jgi:transposase
MDYFAGLDISMETHVCVVDRHGAIVHEAKMASTPEATIPNPTSISRQPPTQRLCEDEVRLA